MDGTGNSIPPTCKIILAATIAKGLLAEVKEGLSGLQKKPLLVGFLANKDPAAQMYADWSAKTCIEK
jgi:methylenetetrahydrofolate dehydrogenase (NAD+)